MVAVDDLTFEVPRGTVTVLLGPNGAGKTTVVRLVTGALHPARAARCARSASTRASPTRAPRYAVAVASCRPVPRSTTACPARDNLRYAAALFEVDRAMIDARIGEAAEPLRHRRRARPTVGGYSTGMRARLALARAVLHEPDLLLLDEPTAGLDPESARTVLGLIDEMAEDGKTVLMCTHLLLEAEGLADQVIVMDHGRAMVAGLARRAQPPSTGPRPGSCSTPTTRACSTPRATFPS